MDLDINIQPLNTQHKQTQTKTHHDRNLVLPGFRRIYPRRMGSYPQEVERKRVMVWGKCWCMITRDSSAESTTFIGGTTLDCIIWLLLETHWSVTFGLGLNHTRLQHFYMIQHVKCCTLMCVNQLPNDSV